MSETGRVRLALIMNPRAGSIGDPSELEAALATGGNRVTVFAPGEAAAAAQTRPDRLVVAGGDGTLGDAFAAAAGAEIPLAVIPAGTANDFAHATGVPIGRAAAVGLATDSGAPTQMVWGGTAGNRPFVNVASVGLAVDAAERAEDLKPRLGPLAYAAGALYAGAVGRAVQSTIEIDGAPGASGEVFQLLVGASGRFGGGSGLGEAAPDDRRLVAAWIPATSRLELPLRALGLRRRVVEHQPGVLWWRGEQLVVDARLGDRPAPWNLDGERWHPSSGPVALAPLGPVSLVVPN